MSKKHYLNLCRFHYLYSGWEETYNLGQIQKSCIMNPGKILTSFWYNLYLFCCQWKSHIDWIYVHPQNWYFWHGWKTNFLIFIMKPKFCKRYMSMSWCMWSYCIKINISSKYIITLMFFEIVRLKFLITL